MRMPTTVKCSKCGGLLTLYTLPDGCWQVAPCPTCIKRSEEYDDAWQKGYKKGFDEGWKQGYLQG